MAARRAHQAAGAPVVAERPWCARGLTVATMSEREFSEWTDAGRPPLAPPREVAPPRAVIDAAISAALTAERHAERAHLERRIAGTVEVIAEEVARVQAELCAQHQRDMQELRAEHERQTGLLQTMHEADMRALRDELEAVRQPERKRLPAPRHNGRAGVQ